MPGSVPVAGVERDASSGPSGSPSQQGRLRAFVYHDSLKGDCGRELSLVDVTPSMHFPTLELRLADSCTRLEDTLAIAALYRYLVRLTVRMPELNRGLIGASRAIVSELWRAQRDGTQASLIDAQCAEAISLQAHLNAVLDSITADAEALSCKPEIEEARQLPFLGTSADRQLAVFAEARKSSESRDEASSAVVDWLAKTTSGRVNQLDLSNKATELRPKTLIFDRPTLKQICQQDGRG